MAEKTPNASRADEATSRLAELKDRVERATKLIAELREANYSLSSEIADLQRKLDEAPSASYAGPPPAAPSAPSAVAAEEKVHEELQQLRDERKIIRAKVQNLLERIERIDL